MDNKITSVKERILQIAKNKGVSKEKFMSEINMTYGNFKGSAKQRPINSDALENILSIYPDIDLEWLLTGKGKMIKEKAQKASGNKVDGIPLIPVEAMAGMGGGDVSIKEGDIQERYVIPDFVDVDFMIRVKGPSMEPNFNSGDVIACKIIKERSFFQWGRVFVIHHREQGTMVKRLFPEKNDKIECRSDNLKFPPFSISLTEITNIALVKGVVRLE